jgi:5-methylcytosine-specific restriction endonuclease McrA
MPEAYNNLYKTARWQRLRDIQLQLKPLCEDCKDKGLTMQAEVVHHIVPHKGDLTLFYTSKLQSLCKSCHDGITQQRERYGFINDIGLDGWPTDHKHPVYAGRKY